MLVHAHGFAVRHGVADHVHVELDVRGGLPAFSVIGLGGGAARDARERVHAAVVNSGFAFPRKRVTANLAPAAPARAGPAFELVLACCVLAVQEQLDRVKLARIGLFAELGLGGDLRPCEGVAAAAEAAEQARLAGLIVARGDLREARAAGALPVAGLSSLGAVAALLATSRPSASARGNRQQANRRPAASSGAAAARTSTDGQSDESRRGEAARRAPAASPNGASAPGGSARGP
ncbi:MAG TPA: magnesium chelatase domain-containing protein [Solirubrobacteraceae bacterium]|nr:magnesium chelatase domain-containing protein [Solirubrobacteraceae bacterium]